MGRPALENKKRQLAVALPDPQRERLELAAAASQHSIAEEIRRRLAQTLSAERLDAPTRELLLKIEEIAHLVRTQTGHDWYAHLDAWQVFRHAIDARLERMRPLTSASANKQLSSSPPSRLVSSQNPEAIGAALEAIAFNVSTTGTHKWQPQHQVTTNRAPFEQRDVGDDRTLVDWIGSVDHRLLERPEMGTCLHLLNQLAAADRERFAWPQQTVAPFNEPRQMHNRAFVKEKEITITAAEARIAEVAQRLRDDEKRMRNEERTRNDTFASMQEGLAARFALFDWLQQYSGILDAPDEITVRISV